MRKYNYECPYNVGVGCDKPPKLRDCEACGWNPREDCRRKLAKRLEALKNAK